MLRGLLHRMWRWLPYKPRRKIVFGLAQAFAPRPGSSLPGHSPSIKLFGPFSTLSGLGEAARNCADAIADGSAGYGVGGTLLRDFGTLHVQTFDISRRLNQDSDLPTPAIDRTIPIEIRRPLHSLAIVHANGPLIPLALMRSGNEIHNHRVIGRWAWELPRIPEEWHIGLRYVHEVWALSTFSADAIRKLAPCPVRVMPIPIRVPELDRLGPSPWHKPEGNFTVLTAFNMASSFERKNPLASIKAFQLAFGKRADVNLVIKTSNLSADPKSAERLLNAIRADSRIVHVEQRLSRPQMYALTRECDVTLSLHRSEGFGMPLAEAMLLGRAVVATGWSGNLDFMNAENACLVNYRLIPALDNQPTYNLPDTVWADPDVEHAAMHLRRLRSEPELKRSLEARAIQDIAKYCSPEAHWRRVLRVMNAEEPF